MSMDINWRVRVRQPAFWLGILGAAASPVLAYLGLTYADLTTWDAIGGVWMRFIANPYLIGLVVTSVLSTVGVIADPTTAGVGDSARALGYEEPREDG